MLPERTRPQDKTGGYLVVGTTVIRDAQFAAEPDGRLRSRQIWVGKRLAAGLGLIRPASHATIMDHVEPQAAAILRRPGAPKHATLVIDQRPCDAGRPLVCEKLLPHIPAAGFDAERVPVGRHRHAVPQDLHRNRERPRVTTFDISWGPGGGATGIATVADLDRVLDSIVVEPDGLPYSVAIFIPDDTTPYPVTLEIGVGHPDRSFAFHVGGRDQAAWAHEPSGSEGGGLLVDYAGQATDLAPHQTRVTPHSARQAAREFVSTGGVRPTNLEWDDED